MIIDAIKGPLFGSIVSFMLGVAIVMVVSPICHGPSCMIIRAPPIHEVKNTVYHIGSKCYKFTPVGMDCPESGIVEAFENMPKAKAKAKPVQKKPQKKAEKPVKEYQQAEEAVEMVDQPVEMR